MALAGTGYSQTQYVAVQCSGTVGYVNSDHWTDLMVGEQYELELAYEYNPNNPLTDHRGRTAWQGPCDVTLRLGNYPVIQDRALGVIYVGEDLFDPERQTISFDVSIESDVPGNETDRIIVELVTDPGQAVLGPQQPPTANELNAIPQSVVTSQPDGFSIRHDTSLFFEVYGYMAQFSASDSPCVVDVNGDGQVSPTDFSAWIGAYNANAPECDQNGDGVCTPTDFSAWIGNYNAGCD